ncbi:S-layer homology domain-containing protein [Alkaliphilus transvaalensis]|uniref:S-layer homology domain-containing protein n=1 Tax=Alkaliphilus transvaalensis TaxID=114628 RepID=UPI0004790DA6|nr:S-layer homology domain-containing protein [Alkaliphilus transvaalensis]
MLNVTMAFNPIVFNDWINSRLQEENSKSDVEFNHLLDTTNHNNTNPHANNHGNNSPHDNGYWHSNGGGGHSNSGSPHSNGTGPHSNGTHDHHNYPAVHSNYTGPLYPGGHHNGIRVHEDGGGHYNSAPHSNSGGNHNNTSSPHNNNSPHDNGYYHNNSGHSNVTHNNTGFDHQNYIPTIPELFQLDHTDRVKDTITIGIFSYDRNVKPAGSTDAASRTIKYNLRIRKVKNLDGTPTVSAWRNLLTNSTNNTFELNTKNPLGAGLNDGIYELEVWGLNDPRSQNGVAKQYVGEKKVIEIVINQNMAPELRVRNGNEFINFIFGPDGAIDVNDGFISYTDTLYTEASGEQQAGIFVSVEMKDNDTDNWQKGWTYLVDSNNQEIAGTRVSIMWDSGEVARSNGSFVNGYAFIAKDKFVNEVLKLEGAKVVVAVQDFMNEACTNPAGEVITLHTISASELTNLSFHIDTVKPNVVSNNEDYDWKKEDIDVSLTYTDDRTGMGVTEYAITDNATEPNEWLTYAGAININIDGVYYIHYRAVDRVGNEQKGYFGPYQRDTILPQFTNDNLNYDWTNENLEINITIDEIGLSGIKSFEYAISDSDIPVADGWAPYVDKLAIDIDGQYYLHIKVIDNAGNEAYELYGPYRLDKQAPSVVTDNEDYDWKNTDIEVNLTYLQNGLSNIASTKYFISDHANTNHIEEAEWLDYTDSITIDTDGSYFIHYMVKNEAGTIIKGVYGPYQRDTVPPSITIIGENGTGSDIYKYVNEINLDLLLEDHTGLTGYFGVVTTQGEVPTEVYSFDTDEGITYTGDGTDGLQHYYVYIKVIDEAGNETQAWSEVYKFNNTAPTVNDVNLSLTDGYLQGLVEYNFSSDCEINTELAEDTLTYRIYQKKVGEVDFKLVAESIFDPNHQEIDRHKLFIDYYIAEYQHNEGYLIYFEIEDLAGNIRAYPLEGESTIKSLELTVRKEIADLEIISIGDIMMFNDRIILGYNKEIELNVTATFVDDTTMSLYPNVTWEISNSSIATLTPIGDTGRVNLIASEIGDLVITVTDHLTGLTFEKEIEILKPVENFIMLNDLELIYGDSITINVDATLEDGTLYENYPYFYITADDDSLVDINGKEITSTGLGATMIMITDAFDSSKSVSFKLLIKKSPLQRLEDIVIPTDTPVPTIDLPELEPGQSYIITVTHQPSDEVVIIEAVEGGSITLEDLLEGHDYDIKFEVVDCDGTQLAEKTINYTVIDITPPVIEGAYMLGGKLYILATDNYKLHNTPYGFTILNEGNGTLMLSVQEDPYGSIILVSDNGQSVTNTNFIADNNIQVAAPKTVIVKVIDHYLNNTEMELEVNRANQVVYGVVPQEIINQINYANNPPSAPSRPPSSVVTETPLPQEVITIIENVLGDGNLKVDPMPSAPNSGTGSLQVQTGKYIDELQKSLNKHNYKGQLYYRIDVIEKGVNRLVYTNTVDDISNIVIPGLLDSTTYIVRVSIVHDGTRLAFKEIEKQTGDATPPVIEKVIISNGMLQVFATDNIALHDAAYQYQLQMGGSTIVFNPFGHEKINGMEVVSIDLASILASNWNHQAWTSESRLSGLDVGTRVRITVRDHANNYTITDVDVNANGTFFDTVNGNQPLNLKPNQSVELEAILADLINKYNQNNPDNPLNINEINLDDFDIRLSDPSLAYFENGRLVTRGNGYLVVTFRDKQTGTLYKYGIYVSDVEHFDRRIIIQTNSETNIDLAFSQVIEREFGEELHNIININEELGEIIELDNKDRIYTAFDQEGLAQLILTNGRKKVPVYVIIVNDKFPESNIERMITKLAFVVKEGDVVDAKDISVFYNEYFDSANTDYLIIETTNNSAIVEGTEIRAVKEGLARINVIDLVTQKMEIIDFRVIAITEKQEHEIKPQDIIGHWGEEEIKNILSRGLLEDLNTSSFRPNEFVTREELLKYYSQLKVYLRDNAIQRRNVLALEINKEDINYHHIMEALNNISMFEVEHLFGKTPSLNQMVTREEVAALLALDLKLPNSSQREIFTDTLSSTFHKQILAVNELGIMGGFGGAFNPQKPLTRAELVVTFSKLIDMLE